MSKTAKRKPKAKAIAKREVARGNRVTHAGSRPPYICVHGPYGGCLRLEYNPDLDMYGPEGTQVDCKDCKYF